MQTVNITSHYAWDQSDQIIELHVPIPMANEIKKDSYTMDVQTRSIQLGIIDHQGVNYNFKISNLCGDLIPSVFEIKFKPNKVILHLQKKENGKHWNDIKIKKISDVYNQMQRRIDAEEKAESVENDVKETSIHGDGPPSNQDTLENAEKLVSEQASP